MRSCPACSTHMQLFWVPAKAGGEVELDRCNECGGVWFDAGELKAASGREVQRRKGTTDRWCPDCKCALAPATLTGGVEVEQCAECAGTFLEARDMEALARMTKATKPPGGTGFQCETCGQRRPFSEASPTLTGLECSGCVAGRQSTGPAPVPVAEQKRSVFARFASWLGGA